jgi:hypothetical protein
MLSRTPNSPTSLSQRALAQRRLRRSAAHRLLCNTNGCATFLEVDADRHVATCPICGYSRRPVGSAGTAAAH